jgi:hypothetical protein
MIVSFFLFGYWYPWWRIADMDFWMVYNAFLLNDGLPQEYFDHTGYLSILLLSGWFRFLHAIGILDVHALSELPPVNDTIAFARAWTYATQAGRLVSLGLAIIFVLAFAYLMRIFIRNWRVVALATFLLAFSGGLAMEERIIRTELLSAGCLTTALLILLIAAQRPRLVWRPLLIGLVGFLSVLAIINKVQAIFLICAFPIVVLPFGVRLEGANSFWNGRTWTWGGVIAIVLAAASIGIPTASLVSFGFSPNALASAGLSSPFIGGLFGIYQVAILCWIIIGMVVFAIYWHVSIAELIATIAAVFFGVCTALLTLKLQYHPNNVVISLNPLEQMFQFAAGSHPEFADGQSWISESKLHFLFDMISGVIARRTFILHSSPRPTIFLEWFVLAATIIALRRGERKLPLQVMVLMGTVWLVDLLGMARELQLPYFIFTDPLVIIAAALLIAKLVYLQSYRWAYPIGVSLIAAHIIVSQAEPVKHAFLRTEGVEVICGLYHHAKRVERFPFCADRRI